MYWKRIAPVSSLKREGRNLLVIRLFRWAKIPGKKASNEKVCANSLGCVFAESPYRRTFARFGRGDFHGFFEGHSVGWTWLMKRKPCEDFSKVRKWKSVNRILSFAAITMGVMCWIALEPNALLTRRTVPLSNFLHYNENCIFSCRDQ